MARRRTNVFGLAFLDAMTCGFGAIILFYMVIHAGVGLRSGRSTATLRAEAERLEDEVLVGHENLVELRNSLRAIDERRSAAAGLATRLLRRIEEIRVELATFDQTSLAREEHLRRLQTELRTLEQDARRLSAATPTEELPGRRLRAFVGDGDRQYLTGLKVGGERIAIVVDASASMLGDTIVNIIRRRNLPDDVKIRADKWQQAVSTVDWLTTQLPRTSRFQLYTFGDEAAAVLPDTAGRWLDAGDREALERAVAGLRAVVPAGGTNLHAGLAAIRRLEPAPDNVVLLVDGLPTRGPSRPRGRKVSAKQRLRLFEQAAAGLASGTPVNVILFPIEGDPMAASAYWKLALATGGSLLSPSGDWP